jgi:hypothetical protein
VCTENLIRIDCRFDPGPRYHRWRNFLLREQFGRAGELRQAPAHLNARLVLLRSVHDHSHATLVLSTTASGMVPIFAVRTA